MRRFPWWAIGLLVLASPVLVPVAAEKLHEWSARGIVSADPADAPDSTVVLVLATAPMVVRDTPNPEFEARLDVAAALYRQGRARYILASGNGQRYGETWSMRVGLLKRGVPGTSIYTDGDATRTWDSVLNARDVFGLDRLLIVSQRAHLARALFLARSLGMHPYGIEAPEAPVADTPWRVRVRPYLAAVLAYYDGWLRPRPPPRRLPVRIGIDPPT